MKGAEWRLEEGAAVGRDFRFVALSRDPECRRFLASDEALGRYRDEDQKEWPFKGPHVVMEFMRSLRDGCLNLKMHHPAWLQKSGGNAGGAWPDSTIPYAQHSDSWRSSTSTACRWRRLRRTWSERWCSWKRRRGEIRKLRTFR